MTSLEGSFVAPVQRVSDSSISADIGSSHHSRELKTYDRGEGRAGCTSTRLWRLSRILVQGPCVNNGRTYGKAFHRPSGVVSDVGGSGPNLRHPENSTFRIRYRMASERDSKKIERISFYPFKGYPARLLFHREKSRISARRGENYGSGSNLSDKDFAEKRGSKRSTRNICDCAIRWLSNRLTRHGWLWSRSRIELIHMESPNLNSSVGRDMPFRFSDWNSLAETRLLWLFRTEL